MLYKIENISKSYRCGQDDIRVLEKISLNVESGERIAVVGPSGSGKSTLLNIIGTVDKADEGRLIFQDKDITDWNNNQLAELRLNKFGFVFQAYHLVDSLTVGENIMLPLLARGINDASRVRALCDELGIEEYIERYPYQLSGGEQQRTAIARALIGEPAIVLADEATGNLDTNNSMNIMQMLSNLVEKRNIGLVFVTHDMSLIKYADRVVELKR